MEEQSITDGEKDYVNQILRAKGDSFTMMEWVTKTRRNKVQKRLLVVGKYRVYSIKRKFDGKKSVQREGHILELANLQFTENTDELCLNWRDFNIEIVSPKAIEIANVLLQNFYGIACDFPEGKRVQLVYPESQRERVTSSLPQAPPPSSPGTAHGFVETYQAYCNLLGVEASISFNSFINDLTREQQTKLDLSLCPGVDTRSTTVIDLRPVGGALKHNKFFDTLVLKGIPRKEAAQELSECFVGNEKIKLLRLCGILASAKGVTALGEALGSNPNPALSYLDLSHNLFGDNGAIGLGGGLSTFKGHLVALHLSNNELSGKGISSLLSSIDSNPLIAENLEYLDLSHNNFGSQGSEQLSIFFDNLSLKIKYKRSSLSHLFLANTKLEGGVLSAMVRKGGAIETLKELDISYNPLPPSSLSSLSILAKESSSLKKLHLRNVKLEPDTVKLAKNLLFDIFQN